MIELLKKFADDTKLVKNVSSEEDRFRIQKAIDFLTDWAIKWAIAFKIMHLSQENPGFDNTMNDQLLGMTDVESDIGVMMSKSLEPCS
jgi:hypothetical protein